MIIYKPLTDYYYSQAVGYRFLENKLSNLRDADRSFSELWSATTEFFLLAESIYPSGPAEKYITSIVALDRYDEKLDKVNFTFFTNKSFEGLLTEYRLKTYLKSWFLIDSKELIFREYQSRSLVEPSTNLDRWLNLKDTRAVGILAYTANDQFFEVLTTIHSIDKNYVYFINTLSKNTIKLPQETFSTDWTFMLTEG